MTQAQELAYAKACLTTAKAKMVILIAASGNPHKPSKPNHARLELESLADQIADAHFSVRQALGETE